MAERLVFCVLLLLLRQQSGVLLGKLSNLRNGLPAQGVKGFLRRLMLGDLRPMLSKKFLLVVGLFISSIDLVFIVIRNLIHLSLLADGFGVHTKARLIPDRDSDGLFSQY